MGVHFQVVSGQILLTIIYFKLFSKETWNYNHAIPKYAMNELCKSNDKKTGNV